MSEPVAAAGIGTYAIALGLIVATTVAVIAGGWIGGAQAAVLVAVVAVVEAILLGRSGVGRLAAAGLAVPLCVAVVVPTTIGLLPGSVTAQGLQHTVGEYILQAFAGLLATGASDFVQWAFMVGLATVIWLCGFWLGWVAFREQRGVLAVLPAVVVLAVNVLNAPSITLTSGPGSSIGLAEVAALLAALLVIGLTELSSLAAGWRGRRVPALRGLRERFTTSLVVASIGVVAASLLVPALTSTDFASNLLSGAGRGSGGAQGTAVVGFSPVVEPGGSLVNHPQPVLTYYTDQGQDAYLAAVDDTVFSAGDWIPDFETALGLTVAAGPIPRDPTALGGVRSTVTAHVSFTSTAGAATGVSGGSLALFPGDPTSSSVAGTVVGSVAGTAGATATPAPTAPGYSCVGDLCPSGGPSPVFLNVDEVDLTSTALGSLETGGSVSDATVSELENAGTDYPSWVLPDAAPLVAKGAPATQVAQADAVASLARQWAQGATDPYDQAAAIESHLRGAGWVYTLTPPATPAGQWSIVYFLDTSHQGYCQYFASAMGAMLRSLGIPTVLVSGYGPGTATGRRAANHQPIFQVTSTDAHVWVEAYFPGYGWIPFEPTPQSTFGGYFPFARGGSTPIPSATAAATRTARATHPTSTPSAATSGVARATGTPAWPLALPAGFALVVTLILAGIRWWRRPRSLAGVWRRLALVAHLSGLEREAAETRVDFARRLSRALGGDGPPLLGDQLGTVAAVSGKAEFSPQGLEAGDRRLWRDAWTALAPALPRLLRRHLLRRRPAV